MINPNKNHVDMVSYYQLSHSVNKKQFANDTWNLWRCICYCKRGLSSAMLVYRSVHGMIDKTCMIMLIGFSQVSQAWSTPKVVNSEKSTRVQTYSWYEHFQMHLKFGYGFFLFLSGGSLSNNKEDIAGRFEVSILLHLCVLMCSPSCCFK